jgi:hypothetical protein
MIIRSRQMAAFEGAATSAFEAEMTEHLRQFAPAQTKPLSPPELKAIVEHGVARAGARGFTYCGPIRLYLELMFLFGSEFDSDPQYPWISSLLADTSEDNQMQRAGKLHEAAVEYLDRVAGKSREHVSEAFDRLAQLQLEQFTAEGFEQRLLWAMHESYPRKAAAAGDTALRTLIREAARKAKELEMVTPRGVALITFMMFSAGHGIIGDPVYARQLRPGLEGGPGAEERIGALHRRAAALLRAVRSNETPGPNVTG